MRIVQVLTASTGGIGRHVGDLAPRLTARGHEVRVVAPLVTARTPAFAELEVQPPGRLLALTRGADVLHAHGYKAAGLALPVARLTRTPLVVTWHNALLPGTAAAARLLRLIVARGADLTLGASTDLVQAAWGLGARRARLSPVVAPCLSRPTAARGAVRAGLGVAPDDLLVLSVGRLAPQKGLDVVLDIAALVGGTGRVHFVIAGEGPELAALEGRIRAEGLPVRLLGARSDVPDLLAAADVALLTSTWEARALVAQEALQAGLPLVSTRVGGIPELVGGAARLFPVGDASAGARELSGLLDDPGQRAALRTAGLRQAATWPDEEDVTDDLQAAYASVQRRSGA